MQQALLAQKRQVEADVAQFDATLAEAEQSIEQFAELISSIDPAGPQATDAATAFDQLVQRDHDGAWRSRPDRWDMNCAGMSLIRIVEQNSLMENNRCG